MAIFVTQQWFLGIRWPASRAKAVERAPVVNTMLGELLKKYYALDKVQKSGEAPAVRCNVMLPVHSWLGLRRRLRIFYKSNSNGFEYQPAEVDLEWAKNNGSVGWTWKTGNANLYCESDPNCAKLTETLSKKQKTLTGHIKSLYSVPILKNGTPVGVLTIDGQENTKATKFNEPDVKTLLEWYATALISQCFEEGVAS